MTQLDLTSWSLIHRAAVGKGASRERFARRYSGVIQGYFAARWRLPIAHEHVQDASQDVFVDCFKPGGALTHADAKKGQFRRFLYGVCKHIAISIERRLVRRTEHAVSHADRVDSDPSLSQSFDRAWARAIVKDAAALARERARGHETRTMGLLVMELRVAHDLPPREIAVRLGRGVHEIYELLRRAKLDLRAAFLEILAEHNPGASEGALKRRCLEIVRDL